MLNRRITEAVLLIYLFLLIMLTAFSSLIVLTGPSFFVPIKGFHGYVGLFYYAWFDEGYMNRHWNQTDDVATTVVDEPVLGWYNSSDVSVINQHWKWFEDLEIDFVISSWWGINSYEDNTTQTIFKTLSLFNNYSTKLCIMIEPFNDTNLFGRSGIYNYSAMYDYIYNHFVSLYRSSYFHYDSKPALFIYNGDNLTDKGTFQKDNRFFNQVVGMAPYVDVVFHNLTGTAVNVTNQHPRTYSIAPRYDDSRLNRSWSNYTIDVNYEKGIYVSQWHEAIFKAKSDQIDFLLLCTWNDYSERTQIEPHYDATAYSSDPYFLYSITKKHIRVLRDR